MTARQILLLRRADLVAMRDGYIVSKMNVQNRAASRITQINTKLAELEVDIDASIASLNAGIDDITIAVVGLP